MLPSTCQVEIWQIACWCRNKPYQAPQSNCKAIKPISFRFFMASIACLVKPGMVQLSSQTCLWESRTKAADIWRVLAAWQDYARLEFCDCSKCIQLQIVDRHGIRFCLFQGVWEHARLPPIGFLDANLSPAQQTLLIKSHLLVQSQSAIISLGNPFGGFLKLGYPKIDGL